MGTPHLQVLSSYLVFLPWQWFLKYINFGSDVEENVPDNNISYPSERLAATDLCTGLIIQPFLAAIFGTVFVPFLLSTGGIFSTFQSYETWPVSFFNYRKLMVRGFSGPYAGLDKIQAHERKGI